MNETILIVDDDPRIRNLLIESLHEIGYQTVAACDGQEALAAVRGRSIDCVVSDIKMPVLDGLNLLHQVKAEIPSMPVIMITGFAFHQHREQATHEGADGFLVKPFRLEKIEEVLQRVLSRTRSAASHSRVIRDILIVEDDIEFRVLLSEIIEALGYNAMSVADAESAVRQINQRCPDAVITDYKLPTMSGEELIRTVKSKHADLPIVLITGYAPSLSGHEFADGAADAFLMKPFRIDRIGTILKELENPAAATG